MPRPTGARVLVVDDEPAIRRAVQMNLSLSGYQVQAVDSGRQALAQIAIRPPDLLILDLGLPDLDGLEVIRELRSMGLAVPIIVLSIRGAERDKVAALDLGADDYLTKPFGVPELLARTRVALRHGAAVAQAGTAVFRTGDLEVDVERRQVRVGGREVRLTPTEYELLKTFVSHPNRVLTDQMLLQAVWGPEYGSERSYLHVYVGRLRKKLEPDAQTPRYIVTEPGVGYRLIADEA